MERIKSCFPRSLRHIGSKEIVLDTIQPTSPTTTTTTTTEALDNDPQRLRFVAIDELIPALCAIESVLITNYGLTGDNLSYCLQGMIKMVLLFATKINSGKPDITSQVCVFDKYVSGFLERATEHFNEVTSTNNNDRVDNTLQDQDSSRQSSSVDPTQDSNVIKNNREKLFFVIWHLYNSVAISVIRLLAPDLITVTVNKNHHRPYHTKDILRKAKEVMEGFNKALPSSTYSTTRTEDAILDVEITIQNGDIKAIESIKSANDGMEVRKIKNNVLHLLKSALKKVSTTKKDFCGQQQDPTQCRFLKLLDTCSLSHGAIVFPEQG
ncbi:hypothetical protein H4219_004818 [Mycoemilia scoparia]|uniref:Uncharacterized protein n=1 Tax=Mycoemilia scoparia TaxID=417184 RepID=A0A9W8DQQ6_9FUNG|nr:hypothetical protein H4219_004818 [Mycoemilia scoparia]